MKLFTILSVLTAFITTNSQASTEAQEKTKSNPTQMTVTQRLAHFKYDLPDETPTAGDYVPFTRLPITPQCTLLFTSGMGSVFTKGKTTTKIQGQVPTKTSPETAQAAARICILRHISAFQKAGLKLDQIVPYQLTCFINSAPEYGDLPKITDAASKIIKDVFGQSIARTTVGTGLPLNYTVEIAGIYALVSGDAAPSSGNHQKQAHPYPAIKVQPKGSPTVFSDNTPDPDLVFHPTPVAPRRPIPPNTDTSPRSRL